MFMIQAMVDGEMKTLYHPLMINDGYAITSGSIDLELGKAGSATLTIPRTNPLYDKLSKMKTTVQIMNDKEEIFCGRILHDEKDFYGNKEIYLEGNLAYLIDRIMPFPETYTYSNSAHTYFGDCMTIYNQQVEGVNPLEVFYLADDNVTYSHISTVFDTTTITFEEHEYVTIQDAIYDKIVANCGGYIKTRLLWFDQNGIPAHTIDYVAEDDIDNSKPGAFHICSQAIEFGENLLDLSEYISAEDTITVLIPLGKMQEQEIEYDDQTGHHKKTVNTQRYDISSVNAQNPGKLFIRDQQAQELYGNLWGTVVFDEIESPTELYNQGMAYLNDHKNVALTLTINAVDLGLVNFNVEKLHIGDYVPIISWPHGFDGTKMVQCKRMSIDILNPGNSEYMFETVTKSISEMQSTTASNVDSVKVQMSYNREGSSTSVENRVSSLESVVSGMYKYLGSVNTFSELPSSNQRIGDVYNVNDTGNSYTWNGSQWVDPNAVFGVTKITNADIDAIIT